MSRQSVGADHSRVIPPENGAGSIEQLEFVRHLFAYTQASALISSASRVLEIGAGEGYGANYVAGDERVVVATDVSLQPLRHLRSTYPRIRSCCQAAGTSLPFTDDNFDAVVSFQVIEHLASPVMFLEEIRRVLKPRGQLILTTPNRKLRLLPLQRPWNPYHEREYRGRELDRLLGRVFRHRHVSGVMAKPEIMLLEQMRVRQRPTTVYGAMIKRVIQSVWPTSPAAAHRPAESAATSDRIPEQPATTGNAIGLADFYLSRDYDRSLDLFAVATKSGDLAGTR